jgi:molybdate transport system substrate-binding protein
VTTTWAGTVDLMQRIKAGESVAYSSGPSGVYLADLFQRWGVMQELKPKIIQTKPGVPVGDVLARGEAEIGFQQVSELLSHPGITYVGPLPPDIQLYTVFAAGTHVSAKERSAVHELTKFLTSRTAEPEFRKSGMEPAAGY